MKSHELEAVERDHPGTLEGPLGPIELGNRFWAYDLERVAGARVAARFRNAARPILRLLVLLIDRMHRGN